jgi:hypothetical protein
MRTVIPAMSPLSTYRNSHISMQCADAGWNCCREASVYDIQVEIVAIGQTRQTDNEFWRFAGVLPAESTAGPINLKLNKASSGEALPFGFC